PAGEQDAIVTDLRLIALRQFDDHLVRPGQLSGFDHCLIAAGAEPGDILAHRAGKKIDVLGQIADMRAQNLRLPLRQIRTIEPDVPALWTPRTDKKLREAGLASAGRPDNA